MLTQHSICFRAATSISVGGILLSHSSFFFILAYTDLTVLRLGMPLMRPLKFHVQPLLRTGEQLTRALLFGDLEEEL